MYCYTCHRVTLRSKKIESSLAVLECPNCNGIEIDLKEYLKWLERRETIGPARVSEAKDSEKALICQRCQRIMIKYRIDSAKQNHLDLCPGCDRVWLDGGEWDLLKSLDLLGDLTKIGTEPWQRKIHDAWARETSEKYFVDALGVEDVVRAREFSRWVNDHPEKGIILKLLRTEIGN